MTKPNLKTLLLAQLPEKREMVAYYNPEAYDPDSDRISQGFNLALHEIRSKLESLDLSDWVRVSDVRAAVENWQEIYPREIFSDPWEGWQKDIDELAKKHGKRIDNISAEYGRRAQKLWTEEFLKIQILSPHDKEKE